MRRLPPELGRGAAYRSRWRTAGLPGRGLLPPWAGRRGRAATPAPGARSRARTPTSARARRAGPTRRRRRRKHPPRRAHPGLPPSPETRSSACRGRGRAARRRARVPRAAVRRRGTRARRSPRPSSPGTRRGSTSTIRTDRTRTLSAIGSSSDPSADVRPLRRASRPSSQSVAIATREERRRPVVVVGEVHDEQEHDQRRGADACDSQLIGDGHARGEYAASGCLLQGARGQPWRDRGTRLPHAARARHRDGRRLLRGGPRVAARGTGRTRPT